MAIKLEKYYEASSAVESYQYDLNRLTYAKKAPEFPKSPYSEALSVSLPILTHTPKQEPQY